MVSESSRWFLSLREASPRHCALREASQRLARLRESRRESLREAPPRLREAKRRFARRRLGFARLLDVAEPLGAAKRRGGFPRLRRVTGRHREAPQCAVGCADKRHEASQGAGGRREAPPWLARRLRDAPPDLARRRGGFARLRDVARDFWKRRRLGLISDMRAPQAYAARVAPPHPQTVFCSTGTQFRPVSARARAWPWRVAPACLTRCGCSRGLAPAAAVRAEGLLFCFCYYFWVSTPLRHPLFLGVCAPQPLPLAPSASTSASVCFCRHIYLYAPALVRPRHLLVRTCLFLDLCPPQLGSEGGAGSEVNAQRSGEEVR